MSRNWDSGGRRNDDNPFGQYPSYQYPPRQAYHRVDDLQGGQHRDQHEYQDQGHDGTIPLVQHGSAPQEGGQIAYGAPGYANERQNGGFNAHNGAYNPRPMISQPVYAQEPQPMPVAATPSTPYPQISVAPNARHSPHEQSYGGTSSGPDYYRGSSREIYQTPSGQPSSYNGETGLPGQNNLPLASRRDSGNSENYRLWPRRVGDGSPRERTTSHLLHHEDLHTPRRRGDSNYQQCVDGSAPRLAAPPVSSRHPDGSVSPGENDEPAVYFETTKSRWEPVRSIADTGNKTGYHLISSRKVRQLGFGTEHYERARGPQTVRTLGGAFQTLGSISLRWLVQISPLANTEMLEEEDIFEIFDGGGFDDYDVIFCTSSGACLEAPDQKTLMMVVVDKYKVTEGVSDVRDYCLHRSWSSLVLVTDVVPLFFEGSAEERRRQEEIAAQRRREREYERERQRERDRERRQRELEERREREAEARRHREAQARRQREFQAQIEDERREAWRQEEARREWERRQQGPDWRYSR